MRFDQIRSVRAGEWRTTRGSTECRTSLAGEPLGTEWYGTRHVAMERLSFCDLFIRAFINNQYKIINIKYKI